MEKHPAQQGNQNPQLHLMKKDGPPHHHHPITLPEEKSSVFVLFSYLLGQHLAIASLASIGPGSDNTTQKRILIIHGPHAY